MKQAFNISNPKQREAGLQAILAAKDGQVVRYERTFTLTDGEVRGRAVTLCRKLKSGWRVIVSGRNRSLEQNAKLWPMLTEISNTFLWHGVKWTPEQWKHFFLNYLQTECNYDVARMDFMPAHDGGYIPVGRKSSLLTVEQFSDLITLIQKFCDEQEIDLREPRHADAA